MTNDRRGWNQDGDPVEIKTMKECRAWLFLRTLPRLLLFAALVVGMSVSQGSAGPKSDQKSGKSKQKKAEAGAVETTTEKALPTYGKGKGVPWTILCLEWPGPERVGEVAQIADVLRNTSGIKPERVSIQSDPDGFVRLYYGTYFRKTDAKGRRDVPKALRSDLDLIKHLGLGPGRQAFPAARMVPAPLPDVGPAEWALTRAPGVYTLQVAAFVPTDDFYDFKNAAAEYCAYLREKGYVAYYHHGVAGSVVTVGSFGADAVVADSVGVPRYCNEVLALQEDDLLKYNVVNGAVLRTKSATASVPDASFSLDAPDRRGASFGVRSTRQTVVQLSNVKSTEGTPVRSQLVYIPGREP